MPYENVPGHLVGPLWEWVEDELDFNGFGLWRNVAIILRVQLDRNPWRFFHDRCTTDAEFMLDVVEAILELRGGGADLAELSSLLRDSNSAYTLRHDGRALEIRVEPSSKDAVQETVHLAGGSAGDHLTAAWNAAYGRQGDAAKAYGEAIKAVEAAFATHISPESTRQTLGTMIRDIRDAPQKWRFAIGAFADEAPGVGTVLGMMELLWLGQTSRHGNARPTRLETPEESKVAVHLAAALVQFGSSGAFQRSEPS